MIKNYLLLSIIFLSLTRILPAQNISAEILYSCRLSNNPFVNELANKKKMDTTPMHIKEMHEKFIEHSVAIDYNLKFNNNESLFVKIKTMSNDANKAFNITESMGVSGILYTNLETKEKLNLKKWQGESVVVKSEYGDTKWQLINETKQIGEQLCYKATSEYKYMAGRDGNKLIVKPVVAWYTTEIPIGFGPAGYGNLPGLIIDLQVGDITYSITKLKLNPKKEIIIKKPKIKGRSISEDQYNGF